jgi:hypothetical protein
MGRVINYTYGGLPLAGGDVILVPSLVTLRFFFLRASSPECHSLSFLGILPARVSTLLNADIPGSSVYYTAFEVGSAVDLIRDLSVGCMEVEAVKAGLVTA